MASPKMSLKLLVDKKGQRVLFAEAPKEFVDFPFNIFSLPLGTLIELLGSKQMVGCLGKLKDSIQTFNPTYIQPGIEKDDIFNPITPFNGNEILLSYDSPSVDKSCASKAIYRCSNATSCSSKKKNYRRANCRLNATLYSNAICPDCRGTMNLQMRAIMPPKEEEAITKENKKKGGFVKEVVTYIVMDNLVVKPMSTISSLALINKFGIKDPSQLEEKVVLFGEDELLKASLKTVKVFDNYLYGLVV